MKPKASIIVPVYNAEKTLRRCVESLVLGLERNIEVILCEDCSKDNSWALCLELAGEFSNVKCIHNKKNSGVSFARNAGLDIAQGQYILFVDSDDWVSEKYAHALLECADQVSSNTLSLCGYHYINYASDSRCVVKLTDQQSSSVDVPITDIFTLFEKTLLPQLWNKIFRRDVIERHHIRFDEALSMGEDYQFVLDYMEAIACKQCVVLNEPLYYYIRWNNSSLMSHFGFAQNQHEADRVRQLARLAGPGSEARAEAMIAQNRRNYVYHISRSPSRTKAEKLEAIERIMGDGKAAAHYRAERLLYAKERTAAMLHNIKHFYPWLQAKWNRQRYQKRIVRNTRHIRAKNVTILSQNNIGGVFYHDMGMQFLSPTVNLFLMEPDFVKFVLDLEHYLGCTLQMRWGEAYPIGQLDDIQIHFMHYDNCQEAKQAWERRAKRIRLDRILVLSTDRNGFDDGVHRLWQQIPYPKVLFTANPRYAQDPDSVFFPAYQDQGFVPDLIPNREFYQDGTLIRTFNQLGGAYDPTGKP